MDTDMTFLMDSQAKPQIAEEPAKFPASKCWRNLLPTIRGWQNDLDISRGCHSHSQPCHTRQQQVRILQTAVFLTLFSPTS